MESPGLYEDSPMDGDDIVYPCKGCGEILEEGKAFELAGNRWHIDCFRCHTCGTLLDSDANLLLLGDGSLICNNCTYSCSACGNKIEDLAILTGDQAFCAGCFRCRSCKRKIDNLRYARTSQGIFCMSCHETLMARRRKKARGKPSSTSHGAAAHVKEKALPSLPASAAPESAFSPDSDTPQQDTLPDSAARPPSSSRRLQASSASQRNRELSPSSDDGRRDESLSRHARSYKDARSPVSGSDAEDADPEQGFLPMAFDPNPAPRVPSRRRMPNELSPAASNDGHSHKDYFRRGEPSVSSRSASHERELLQHMHFPTPNPAKMSPHIAYQDRNAPRRRNTSGHNTPASNTHPNTSPVLANFPERDVQSRQQQQLQNQPQQQPHHHFPQMSPYSDKNPESFTLQDVPQDKKSVLRTAARNASNSPRISPINAAKYRVAGDESPVSASSDVNPFEDPRLKDSSPALPIPARHADRPMRGDSLAASKLASTATSTRSSIDQNTPITSRQRTDVLHDREESVSSVHTSNLPDMLDDASRFDKRIDMPPPRNSSRPSAAQTTTAPPMNDFTAPRKPPTPQTTSHQRSTSSQLDDLNGTTSSPVHRAGALPQFTADQGFSMDQEMSRIMKGERDNAEHSNETSGGLLRKVSNAVKHGRSFSDRGSLARIAAANNGAESSVASATSTVSSPLTSPAPAQETIESLRAQLRRAQHRIAELETEKVGLESRANSSTVINEMNSELREKRTTMAFLDTQREIVVRELETMTRHLQHVKDEARPLDLPKLKSDILEDFAASLQSLKNHIGTQIEELMRKRNELTNEITDLIAMKDKGFQEYESLSSKNAQLVDMNQQLLQSIQEGFKGGRDPRSNGLGIHAGARVDGSSSDARYNMLASESSMPNLLSGDDGEAATMLPAPQVVNIRKGQVKKFNWRRGGEKVAKGVKGIIAGGKPAIDVSQIGMPYGMTQQAVSGGEQMYGRAQMVGDRQGAGFGLFNSGQKNGRPMHAAVAKDLSGGMVTAADPSSLFGSELEARCDYEKRVIPGIVTRCIAEVEARGMRVEGIYRKSGGSGQVKSVQAGFEKDTNHDISDPDLEIHAVTSALKQYFRKLPTPLITYDVYDSLLEAGSVSDKERQAIALRHALGELPPHHHGCLEYLVRHLARIMSLDKDNLMTPLNLAVVFAPTIMRPLSIEREMSDGLAQRAAVQALLEQHEIIFEEE